MNLAYTCTDWACGNWIEYFFGPQSLRRPILRSSSATAEESTSAVTGGAEPGAVESSNNYNSSLALREKNLNRGAFSPSETLLVEEQQQEGGSSRNNVHHRACSVGGAESRGVIGGAGVAVVAGSNSRYSNGPGHRSISGNGKKRRKVSSKDHRSSRGRGVSGGGVADPNLHNILEELEDGLPAHKTQADVSTTARRGEGGIQAGQ